MLYNTVIKDCGLRPYLGSFTIVINIIDLTIKAPPPPVLLLIKELLFFFYLVPSPNKL